MHEKRQLLNLTKYSIEKIVEHIHEFDIKFLDEISKKAKSDSDVQLLLDMIAKLNAAIREKRPVKENYLPMLEVLLAAHGTLKLDLIRFVSHVGQQTSKKEMLPREILT